MNIAEAMDVAEESQNREAGNQLASFSPEEFLDNIISAVRERASAMCFSFV